MNKSQKILAIFLSLLLVMSAFFSFDIMATAQSDAPSGNFITFSSTAPFTINATKRWNGMLEYSTNGASWEPYTGDTDLTAARIGSVGDYYLCFRGTGNSQISATDAISYSPWNIDGSAVACNGNIEYLLDYVTVAAGQHPTMANYCFNSMFNNCTALTEAPELSATSLANSCYYSMFYGCTSLREAPALPATTMKPDCYNYMFRGCIALRTAPALPATELADYCYRNMFYECTSLIYAPELPATTLTKHCYESMFERCSSLREAPELPATTLAGYCYASMFYSCASLATAPVLPALTLSEYCYNHMFQSCTALREAPELPATSLATYCYAFMFTGCTALRAAPELPVTTLADYCYANMFYGCTYLRKAPELPATTLTLNCYSNMFRECTSLIEAPELPATTLAFACYHSMFYNCKSLAEIPELPALNFESSCYNSMFRGCSAIKLYQNAADAGDSPVAWSFPEQAAPHGAGSWNTSMFYETGGEFTETPDTGMTFYYSAPVCYLNAASDETAIDDAHRIVITDITASTDISDIVTPITGYTVTVAPSHLGAPASYNGTGTVISVMSGSEIIATYTLVVKGDVNGDSLRDARDCMIAELASSSHLELTDCYLSSMDFNENKNIDSSDLRQFMNYTVYCQTEINHNVLQPVVS